jgi:tape measure domain-containing protein
MADSENLDVVIRSRGGRQAAADAKGVEQAIGGVGRAAHKTSGQTDDYSKSVNRSSTAMRVALRTAGALTAGFGVMSAVGAGVNFVSTMEQNQIAFTQFLKSSKAANAEIKALQNLSNEIPAFSFADYATNAKKLLAMGTPIRRLNKDLKTIAETALGLGLGAEGVNRITLALGQMRSTGVVQGDELRQLQEAGIKVYDYLIKAGLITRQDIGKIGDMHLDAATAIDAIMRGMQSDFGGLAKKSSKTWAFQLGALKNQATQAAGALVEPIVKFAESDVLPKLTRFFKDSAKWLKEGGSSSVYSTLGKLAPWITAATTAWLAYRAALLLVTAAQKAMAAWGFLAAMVGIVPLIWAAATGTGTWAAAMAALTAATDANLIVVAIAAVVIAIAALVTLFIKWEWFHRAVVNTFEWLLGENTGHGTKITPLAGQGAARTLQPIRLEVDGRVLAEIVVDQGMTAAARA